MIDLHEIERWAAACIEHEAEFWIPEPVAHELAHHAYEVEEKFLSELQPRLRDRKKRHLPPISLPPLLNIDNIIESMVDAGAEILPLDGEDAIAALYDQIDQTGPAERKKDIKTGASDSAWVRTFCNSAAMVPDGNIILVCNDLGAVAYLESYMELPNVQVVKHFGGIMELLDDDKPVDPKNLASVTSALEAELMAGGSPLEDYGDLPLDDEVIDMHLSIHAEDLELQDCFIENVEALPSEGDVLYSEWTGSYYGSIALSFTVRASYVAQDWLGNQLISFYASASKTAEVTFREYEGSGGSDKTQVEIDDLRVDSGNTEVEYEFE
ncbi:hypothetical protein ACTXO9_01400 [Brachybacterium tyrofermentans]|uniref:hypothetical protein n=1 Tax=Brachybacterium tyrofermentans TaxID=47848 RepID=UPI003FD4DA13